MRQSAFTGAIGLLVAVFAAGCSDNPDRCYPVRGVIVYEDDDQPATALAGGSVSFSRIEGGSSLASGPIEADGSFVLSTRKEGDGAVAGKHRVEIEVPGQEAQTEDVPRRPALKTLIDPRTAVQEVTVEKKSNSLTLKVKRSSRKAR